MSEKIKGMYGSETRADEVIAWLKSQGAERCLYNGSAEDNIYYVDQGDAKVVNKRHSALFDIVELPRWRAKYAEKYCYVSERGCVKNTTEDFWNEDDERYECGNYFKTQEEADIYAEKFREIFKERREK